MKLKITLLLTILLFIGIPVSGKSKLPPNYAQFNASTYSGCQALTVTFYNSSIGNGTYSWNFGDPASGVNNTSFACSPTHTFVSAGTYTVTLTYVYNMNTYTATATITVFPRPAPSISGPDTTCSDAIRTYTATGFGGSTYFWQVTGGSISGPANLSSVNVNWTTPGVGVLTVTETTINGCSNKKTKYVLVAQQPRLGNFCSGRKGNSGEPNKDSIPKPNGCRCQNSITTFEALDIFGNLMSNQVFTFSWTVTGGSIVSGQGTNTLNVLVGAGPTMKVKVVVKNPFGCVDSGECTFDVCPAPKANFKADTVCLTGTTNFNASSSSILSQISQFTWDFGDATPNYISGTPFTTHTYATAGVFNVKLTVKNADGCTDDTIIKVKVNPGQAPPINCVGTVCRNTNHCYSSPYFAGATYIWTVSGNIGTPIISGPAGDSICVTWGAGPMGTIQVEVIGGPYLCGKNKINVPIFPSNINVYGPDTACTGSTTSWSTDIIPGSCYSWTLTAPGGTTTVINPINNPGNMVSITFPNIPGTYQLTLDMTNELVCCKGKKVKTIVIQDGIKLFGPFTKCEYQTATYTSNVPVTWSVGNGSIVSSTTTSCTITWGSATLGTITCVALNPALVCQNTVSFNVTLVASPVALPINGNTLTCRGATEIYSSGPLPGGVTVAYSVTPAGWSLVSPSPYTIKFNLAGNYTIQAIYTNTAGCKDTSYLNVTVLDTLKPTISGPTVACLGEIKNYTLSSNPGNAWQWQIIGGQILSQTSTTISIKWGNINQGQVNIQNTLCGGFKSLLVTINNIPSGIITLGNPSCKGDTVRMTGPPGMTYLWSTGQTTQSILANAPTTSYWLQITQNGCKDTILQNFSPFPKYPKPNVNITYTCMLAPSTPVPYQMLATYDPAWSYSWTPQTAIPASTDTMYSHYSTVYNSTHTVIVTNKYGCKDTASVTLSTKCVDTIFCNNPPCQPVSCKCSATVIINYDPCTGTFSFTQTSGGSISAVLWNFNDGDYSNQFSPIHWFTTNTTKTITLSVWCGCNWVTVTQTVAVPYILRPKIKHIFPTTCNYNLIQVQNKPVFTVQGATSVSIDWGDFTSPTLASPPQNHTYASAGTYIITYTVSAVGCTKYAYDTVVILPFNVQFGFCDSGCVGQAVQFRDQSTTAPQWPMVNWNWTFGDATSSNLQNPFHIYNSAGTYNVQLIGQNQQGCKDTANLNIVITVFSAGSITFKKNGVTVPAASTFTICQGGNIEATGPTGVGYTYTWSDGKITKKDTITTSGVYWLIVANNKGCTDKLGPFTVIVNPNPIAGVMFPDTVCLYTNNQLIALSGPGYSYSWTPLGQITNPAYYYASAVGNQTINLTVTNFFGCSASTSFVINTQDVPAGSISASTTGWVCDGDSIKLTATITNAYVGGVWNTGSTSLSIWVKKNGMYTFTAVNASGCSTILYYFVSNFGKRPDLSNVPKGCYKVCGKTGVTVCGPYPEPSQTLTYQWYNGVTPISTSQNLVITANGNYWVTVTDAVSGCSSTSAPFSVQYTTSPSAVINSSTPNPTICIGFPGSFTLCANNPVGGIVYSWYHNNVLVSNNVCFNATLPGTYVLTAYFSECCWDSDTIIIHEGDCCFPPNTNFTLIQDSTVYTSNTVWDGKYYVAGRVYVRNTAILDITQNDIVFDRDGEIIFEDSTILRATNSTFRPCDMNDAWQGISFTEKSLGIIQNCNFKNADSAIFVKTFGPECVRIIDNIFSNCHAAITIARQQSMPYTQGITHNSFVVDNTNFNTPALYNSIDFWGIRMFGTRFEEIVSQNNFRSSDKNKQGNRFFGIWGMRSAATMSENTFTNMYRAIDWTSNLDASYIENSDFEQTYHGIYPNDYQIRISNGEKPMLVYGNTFHNSDNNSQNNTAIYAENFHALNIRDNNVEGFKFGIYTINTNNIVINENHLDNVGHTGIFNSNSTGVSINCNSVRMKDYRKPFGLGFGASGIYMLNGNSTNRIFTNCIFDTRYAIAVIKTGAVTAIPQVHNNYMYNFIVAGVFSQNHSGTIGTSANPGKNTFVCNNHNNGLGGKDVWAIGAAVNEQCNFGVAYLGGLATSSACPSNTMYSSTAACGQHIVNAKFYKVDQWDNCDIFNDKLDIIIIDGTGSDKGKTTVNPNVIAGFAPENKTKEEVMMITKVIISQKDQVLFNNWMNKVNAANIFNAFELNSINAQWAKETQGVNAGLAILNNFNNGNANHTDMNWMQSVLWKMELGMVATTGDLARLQSIDQQNLSYSHIARDIVQLHANGNDYKFSQFAPMPEPDAEYKEQLYEKHIVVMPNPTAGKIYVEYSVSDINAANMITVTDAKGAKVNVKIATVTEGRAEIHLENFAAGVYIVSIYDAAEKKTYNTKVVKQ